MTSFAGSSRKKKSASPRAVALILAGGESLRLFPFQKPKPLLEVGTSTLLEQCLSRVRDFDEVSIVTNAKVAKHIRQYFKARKKPCHFGFILEPEARDTAAAVGFAISRLKNSQTFVGVFSADQYMSPQASRDFLKTLQRFRKAAEAHPDHLFVMGSPSQTKPKEEYSRYGWIVPQVQQGLSPVLQFVEKPQGRKLTSLLKKNALINCGMFFGTKKTFEEAFSKHFPEVLEKNIERRYSQLPKQPVDRAIFEKFSRVCVWAMNCPWEDLGTWEAVDRWRGTKSFWSNKKNLKSSKSNFVERESDFEVYLFDVENLAVVQSGRRLLVMPKAKSGDLKSYLSQASNQKGSTHD